MPSPSTAREEGGAGVHAFAVAASCEDRGRGVQRLGRRGQGAAALAAWPTEGQN